MCILSLSGCGSKADILFVVDGSGSVGKKKFKKGIDFVNTVVKQFRVGKNENRIGVIQFSSKSRTEFAFDEYLDNEKVAKAIDSIAYTKGGTRTDRAINMAMDIMKTVRCIIIIIIVEHYIMNALNVLQLHAHTEYNWTYTYAYILCPSSGVAIKPLWW